MEHEFDNAVLHVWRELHLDHDAVDDIELLIIMGLLLVDRSHKGSHVTKNEG
jgi:hypothetical protein